MIGRRVLWATYASPAMSSGRTTSSIQNGFNPSLSKACAIFSAIGGDQRACSSTIRSIFSPTALRTARNGSSPRSSSAFEIS